LGSKCKDQETPAQEKLQSKGCRPSASAVTVRPGPASSARMSRRSARASRSARVAGR